MITEYLRGLKRVTSDCFDVFAPFYEERQRHYVYPSFYQSVTQMIAAGGFFYKIFNRNGNLTLAIFKRSSIMGNYTVMLHIAPINIAGNKTEEVAIMQEARRLGISLKVTMEDIKRYRIPTGICKPIKGNYEYIYDANECYTAAGGKFQGFRRQRNKITRLQGYRHTVGYSQDIEPLVKAWDDHCHKHKPKGQQTSQLSDWRNIKHINHPSVKVHGIYVDGQLECFSVIERLTTSQWCFVMGMRNFNSLLNDVNVCMHWLDCELAHDDKKIAVYANMGASLGITGLSAAKEKLKPCFKQQIYKIEPIGTLNLQAAKTILKCTQKQ